MTIFIHSFIQFDSFVDVFVCMTPTFNQKTHTHTHKLVWRNRDDHSKWLIRGNFAHGEYKYV